MKVFKSFIFLFLFLCNLGLRASSSSSPKSDNLSPPPSLPLTSTEAGGDAFISIIKSETFPEGVIYLFAFNVGQGNFTLLRHKETAILIDAGSKNKDDKHPCFPNPKGHVKACLEGAKIKAIIITHTDDDHYNYLGEDWLKEILPKGTLLYVGGTFGNAKGIIEGLGVDSSQLHSRVPGELWRNSLTTFETNESIERCLNALIPGCVFNFLCSPRALIHPNEKNLQSLVFLLTYSGRSILFTGDATGETLDCCLYGGSPLPDIVGKNRELMKRVNILMVPHHGSETDGSFRWTHYVLKHSKENFLGAIISVDPHTSPYGHAHNWIRELSFPASARSDEFFRIAYATKEESGRGRDTYCWKEKLTHNRIYITGMSSPMHACCFQFKSNGDITVLSEFGWEDLSSVSSTAEEVVTDDTSDDEEEAKSQSSKRPRISILASLDGYERHNVLGDGNCGIYAILQGANPSVLARLGLIYGLDYDFSISSREDTPQWQNAKKLREFLFEEGHPQRKIASGLSDGALGARELESSDLPRIAQRLGQNILLFTEDMQKVEWFCADGSEQVLGNKDSLPALSTCICLYHSDNHFQAIVPKTK